MERSEVYRTNEIINLESILQELKDGKKIGISVNKEKHEDFWYYEKELSMAPDGEITLLRQNCFSDNCACNSHPRWITDEIDISLATRLIKKFLETRDELIAYRAKNKKEIEVQHASQS